MERYSGGYVEFTHNSYIVSCDVILFAEASVSNIQNVLTIIKLFCQGLDQRINVEKSLVFTTPGTSSQVRNILFRTNNFKGRYRPLLTLGSHISDHPDAITNWHFLLNRKPRRSLARTSNLNPKWVDWS